jgi:hypothetical protein
MRGASSSRSRCIMTLLCTPPPQTSTSCVSGACWVMASHTLYAVSSSKVACTSAGFSGSSMGWLDSQFRWKYSRPVLFGGGSAKYSSDNNASSNRELTLPAAAKSPSRSKGLPRCRRHQASSKPLAGPVSKPDIRPSRASTVMLAMPPRLSTTRP